MKLLFFTMKRNYKINSVLNELSNRGILHATVFDTASMHSMLSQKGDDNEVDFLSGARDFLGSVYGKTRNVTIMMLLKKDEVPKAIEAIEVVTGDLNQGGKGMLITVPVDFIKGSVDQGR